MQLAGFTTRAVDEELMLQETKNCQLAVTSLSRYYSAGTLARGLYLGYARVAMKDMQDNILALKKVFEKIIIIPGDSLQGPIAP